MATTLNTTTFLGKNYSTMQNVVKNEESLTLKQMFDVTAQIVHNEEEIYCLNKIVYQKKGDPRSYVCQTPGALVCVSPCVSILGPFWVHLGSILGPFWVHLGSILLIV